MDTTDPDISFDENGRCDFCENFHEVILPGWHTDDRGGKELKALSEKIKQEGKNKKYDCLIGLSGGVDSSYLTYIAVKRLGLKPLMLSVDTGWNLDVANENVQKVISTLNLDIETIEVDWEEMKDLQVAFLKSGVPYQDFPQDHAIFAGLFNFAAQNGFKYVLTGGNYSTEGVKPPKEWTYLNDIRFMKDVHKRFGKRPLKSFPMCGMFKSRLYYRYFKGIIRICPLNYVPYQKETAISVLEKEFGWETYANKHYEDIFTRFYEGYWLPKRFGYDKRKCYFSSLILSGQMTREEALKGLSEQPYDEKIAMQDLDYICGKLEISKKEMLGYMSAPHKTYRDYRNSYWLIRAAIKAAMLFGVEKRNFR